LGPQSEAVWQLLPGVTHPPFRHTVLPVQHAVPHTSASEGQHIPLLQTPPPLQSLDVTQALPELDVVVVPVLPVPVLDEVLVCPPPLPPPPVEPPTLPLPPQLTAAVAAPVRPKTHRAKK